MGRVRRMNIETTKKIAAGRAPEAKRALQVSQLDIDGQQLRVGIWPGERSRVPLLMFNGIGVGLEFLQPFADDLGATETITFDIPGAGGSPAPRRPYRLAKMARLASKLLDMLGYDRVDVLGLSWGGTLAQQFALHNPRRCRRLVLVATMPGTLLMTSPSVMLKMATPRRFNDSAYRKRIFPSVYGGAARTGGGVFEKYSTQVLGVTQRGYLMQQLALIGWTSVPWLPLLRQRTLVMAGNDDPIIPLPNARLMALLIPRARLHVLHDGHLFILSDPAGSARVVREFLGAPEAG